ncbi:MAG TPA: preprotein translocase subunit YajC [Hyphomonadaceae bacterium]|jgi:protein translocase subunit yajC|nr:preprotein translocase subunit YajC [Hyphomonadaceae bacterium]
MFISNAFAQAATAPAPAGDPTTSALLQFLPLIGIFVIFYFLIIRPQQKRMKDHRDMISNLKRGDTVVTSGGLIGKVAQVDETEVKIDLGENVKVRVVRSMVAEVRNKPEPAPANDTKSA